MPDPFTTALRNRQPLPNESTDALRLIDGTGDGLPCVILETFAGRWLLSTDTAKIDPEVREWLRKQGHPTYWKRLDQHQKESPTHLSGPEVAEPFLIRENGL